MNPAPLDPVPTLTVMVVSVLSTTALLALGAMLMCAISQRHAGVLAMAVFAGVWGPHTSELAGWHRVGWAPTVVIAAMGPFAPAGAVVLTVASGAAGPTLRDGAAPRGLVAGNREVANRLTQPDVLLVTVEGVGSDDGMMDEGRWGRRSRFSPTNGWTHYTTAIAPAPSTLPSAHSLLTSLPVRDHGGGLTTPNGDSKRVNGVMSLPVALQLAGYETTAVIASPMISPEHGFADGFDRWMHASESSEPLVMMGALNRLSKRWTDAETAVDADRDQRMVAHALDVISAPSVQPRFVWVHLAGTDDSGDVQQTRAQILKLAAASGDWVMAVASMHATEPTQTGPQAAVAALSDDALEVPLAIRRPGVEGGVVSKQVAVADVAHTLLAFAGKANPFPGRNLHGPERKRIVVGGARGDANTFAARSPQGHYLSVEGGRVGRTVRLADATRHALKESGYTD